MKVFEWQGNTLLGSLVFYKKDISNEATNHYLSQSIDCLSYVIVDVIDEEFRTETIPLVNSRERNTLISRLKDRHYRDIDHIQIQTSQILKGERKEEELLICALSNYESIQPWIDLLIKHKVPIAGIWSAALLQSSILRLIEIKANNILLVSRELPYAQRETFFLNGKVRFSRLEKLETDFTNDHDPKRSVKSLQQGTEQIRHYLTNHRIIRFNESISVICVVPSHRLDEYNALKDEIESNDLKYTFIRNSKIGSASGYSVKKDDPQDVALSWVCQKQLPLKDNYATNADRQPFFNYAIEKGLKYGAIAAAITLIFSSALLWVDSINYQRKTQSLIQQKNNLVDYYNAAYGTQRKLIESAEAIAFTVEKYNTLNTEAKITPQRFFTDLATVYSQSLFENIQLDQLMWSKLTPQEYQDALSLLISKNSNDDNFYEDSGGELDSNDQNQLTSTIRLRGNVTTDGLSYRTISSIMNEFFSELEKLPSIEKATILKIPFDIRPVSKFRDQTGKHTDGIAKEEDANKYEVLLTVKREAT